MYIRPKLFISYLIVIIIPILLLSILFFITIRSALEKEALSKLSSIAELKASRVESIFKSLEQDIAISQNFYNIRTNIPLFSDAADGGTEEERLKALELLDKPLKVFVKEKGLLDVKLLDLQGRTVYSVNKQLLIPPEDGSAPHFSRDVLEQCRKGIWISDVFKHFDYFAMMIAAPIYDLNDQNAGFIVFEVNMDPVYAIIEDTTGLGKTGETLIGKRVGDGAVFLSTLRHSRKVKPGKRAPAGGSVGYPLLQAVRGNSGSGIETDYRGERVIAVWRYVPLLDLGLVAKIDTMEAFAPIAYMKNFIMVLAFITIMLTAVFAFFLAKSISDPIRRLQKGTEIIGNGNLEYKVGTDIDDEIGQLSRAIDKMIADLKNVTASHDELNYQVTERKKAEEELRKKIKEMEVFNKAAVGREIRMVELKEEIKRLKRRLDIKD